MNQKEIRTRFAPSPSGFLHIGSARTALFAYLFAKQNKGKFILRIEDTNLETSKKEFEEDIIEHLKWLSIEWDEFYKQSERFNLYNEYINKLLKENKAYYCFCSEEELEAQKQYKLSIGEPPIYSGKCSQLNKQEIEKLLSEKKKCTIKFKTPIKKIKFTDIIRGELEFDTSLIGDFSIAKYDPSNKQYTPLYNFSVTIDDFKMNISYVIRGEDLLSSTPKQILIQEALGFTKVEYAHLPILLAPDKSKLSKRKGAKSIKELKQEGYLKEALINFIAFLGWNPGDEKEIYFLPSLIKDFSLERVQKGGAIFNIQRLDFLNGFHIRQKSIEKLTELCLPYLIEEELIEEIK